MNLVSRFNECSICYEEYDLDDHIAVRLQQCNHTFGKKCVEALFQGYNSKCPQCKVPFPFDSKKYMINLEIRELVEYKSKFEKCSLHKKPLDLYCEEDQLKICYECQFMKGNNGHKRHAIERIEDYKEMIDERKILLEEEKQKCQKIYGEARSILGKRRLDDRTRLDIMDSTTKLVGLNMFLRDNALTNDEEDRIEDAYGDGSVLRSRIDRRLNRYKEFRTSDLKEILNENTHNFSEKLRNMILRPQIKQEQCGLISSLKVRSYVKFELKETLLVVSASDQLFSDIFIDFEGWEKKAMELVFVFYKFDFNEEDSRMIHYVLLRLQRSIRKISAYYRKIDEAPFRSRFQNHLTDFSRSIFALYQSLEKTDFRFCEANGSDHFLAALTERIKFKSWDIIDVSIQAEVSDLTETTLINFCNTAKTCMKNLKSFKFVLKHPKNDFEYLRLHAFELRQLKRFTFQLQVKDLAQAGIFRDFLQNSIGYMRGLEEVKLEIHKVSSIDHVLGSLATLSTLQLLQIRAPNSRLDLSPIFQVISKTLPNLILEVLVKDDQQDSNFFGWQC